MIYKGKVIGLMLEKTINELNFHLTMLKPDEWKNPATPAAKAIKDHCQVLQHEINESLKFCPDAKVK